MRRLPPVAMLAALLLGFTFHGPATETSDNLTRRAKALLAPLDGDVVLSALKEPVEVLRDRWGVAHIYAKNADDLFFAQGFVVAQDRLFQIDLWRRVARGETAEIVGKKGLDGDRFARLMKYRGDMEAEWTSYSPDTQRIATQFTKGINACIDQMGKRLPIEFEILGYAPAKWQPEDVLGRMSGIIMMSNFRNELLRSELIAAVGVEKARKIVPTDPVQAFGPAPGLDLKGIDRSILSGFDAATRALPFEAAHGGSNNWAIDGTLSASGKPMLASDPHRSINLPSLRYIVHLNAPGWNVIGSGEPALPGVAIGHNDKVAWGFTIVGTDQTDFYVEETKTDDPTQYKVGDRWEPMKVIKEKVKVRGEKEPVELELRFTRHGPVVHQDAKRHRAFALRWVGMEPGTAAYLGSLALDRAQNARDFREALRRWKVPSLNMVYADVDGTIGWLATGLNPVRKGWNGLLPVPGAGSEYEWQGFRPLDELAQVVNPPSHYVATANHNILPADYKHEISYEWAAPYRFLEIKKRLESKKKFDLDDMKSIQHDNTSLPGQALAKLIKSVEFKDTDLQPYVRLMADWDGVLSRESQAGPLYAIWMQELLDAFYRPQVPAALLDFAKGRGGIVVMLQAMEKPDAFWFGDNPAVGRDEMVRKSFAAAVPKVKKALGPDMAGWSWGKLHTTTFRHPLAGIGPEYAKAFNLGPVPRPGDGVTPNANSHDKDFRHVAGASYRHVFDLADWDRGVATNTPGQSGQPGSPHYADLLPMWEEGAYFPLAFSRPKVEAVTQHRLTLKKE
ncbi:MAG: penicillin acylase family protein [Gemmataceae bacterium]|nr:penicillin acylase family protein [Gemmataceae bacterium]